MIKWGGFKMKATFWKAIAIVTILKLFFVFSGTALEQALPDFRIVLVCILSNYSSK
jgi:hypothetical protein